MKTLETLSVREYTEETFGIFAYLPREHVRSENEERQMRKFRFTLYAFLVLLLLLILGFGAVVFVLISETGKFTTIDNVEIGHMLDVEAPVALWDAVIYKDTLMDEIAEQELLMETPMESVGRIKRSRSDNSDYEDGSGFGADERTKREGDCQDRFQQLNDKIDKVVKEVGKIHSRLDGLKGTELQAQGYGAAQYPLCFFQPDPTALQMQSQGQYVFTENRASGPVTCVYLPFPTTQTLAPQEQGKVIKPEGSSSRNSNDGNRERKNSKEDTKPLDFWPQKGLPLPNRSRNSENATDAPRVSANSARAAGSNRANCEEGHVACKNGKCILERLWCDASVDCDDGSDEAVCNCRHRVDEIRLCDNYMDCPNGEDENGCHGCPENTHFSCTSRGPRDKEKVCLSLTKRCDGHEDCPSGSDEKECSALLEEMVNTGQVDLQSHISGYLHINHHGQWFPLCNPDADAALKACRAESGPEVSSEDIVIKLVTRDTQKYKDVLAFSSDHEGCTGKTVAYVQCPLPMCGTRILDESPIASPKAKRVVGGRIVGGKLSKPTAWPYLVAIFRDGRFHCGGSLIRDDWVLSAAHCVHDYHKHFYEIQAGMLRRLSFSPQEQTRTVTHVIVRRDYNRQVMTNDLSLLKIDPPVRMSRWARHICLPPPGLVLPEPGTNCITIGWGATKEHGADPDQIHEVDVPILETCKHIEDRRGVEICAGLPEGGKDACQGDSGGPLLCQVPNEPERWYVAGVVSHGEGCARPNEPGAYTRVGIFLDWINYFVEHERHLPKDVPVAKCPSIECSRVGGRCLSASMVCDKIVDCLNAEDELNCKSFRSREDGNSTLFREEEFGERPSVTDTDEKLDKFYNNQKVKQAFQTLKDAGLLKNVTAGLIMPKYFLHHIKSDDSRVSRALKDLNETGIAEVDTLMNVSRIINESPSENAPVTLDQNPPNNTTNGPPSASEATLEPLNSSANETAIPSSTDQPENKIGDVELPAETSTSTSTSTTTTTTTTTAPPPPSTSPAETKGGEIDLTQLTTTIKPFSNATDGAENKGGDNEPPLFSCDYGQVVPMDRRCDTYKDCEDGSDEKGCSCRDYLMTINQALICNGELDCRDLSDERGCNSCSPDELLCPLSKKCVKQYQICDRNVDCLHNEDERFCFALVEGPYVTVDQEYHAVLRKKGFLSYKQGKFWYPLCLDYKKQPEALAADICANLGFSYYTNVAVEKISNAPLDEYPEGYYANSNYGMLRDGAPVCDGLWVECGNRIYTPPRESTPPCGDASWSWFAAIYREGKYTCGATIVNPDWLITSKTCAQKINLGQDFVGVLMGSNRLPGKETPHEQTRRAVLINEIEYRDAALIKLDVPIVITRHVMPLQLQEWYEEIDDILYCMAMGPSGINGSVISTQFKPVYCEQSSHLCLERICSSPHLDCESPYAPKTISWSGALACQNRKGSWFPMAVFDELNGPCGFKEPIILEKIQNYLPELNAAFDYSAYSSSAEIAPFCRGLRCPLGLCVPTPHLCDGLSECRDWSDEANECYHIKREKLCFDPENPYSCVCGPHNLPCKNGYCVEKSRFCDGYDDCGDASDEPPDCKSCAAYLNIVDPLKICDGNRNCHDKSDETGCGCKSDSYHCINTLKCIPPSFKCDGEIDCPEGDDEFNCVAVRSMRSNEAAGDVLMNTCGNWHEFCPPLGINMSTLNVPSTDMCREMGFHGENARTEQQIALGDSPQPYMDSFFVVSFNDKTTMVMRPSSRSLVEMKMSPCPSIVLLDCGGPLN